MVSRPRIYIDSCCLIDLVKHEVLKLPDTATADFWYTKQLLQAHRDGEVQIVTSILSAAECVGVEPGQTDVPPEAQALFRRLLTSGQYLHLRQTTPRTGLVAQDLRWKHNLVLGGPDAIHLATAIEAQAVEVLTNDGRLRGKKVAAALPQLARVYGMRVITPSMTRCLPDRYKQGDILNA